MILAAIVPDNAQILAVARQARAAGMQLIHSGRDIVVSPVCPPGWRPVIVKVKANETQEDRATAPFIGMDMAAGEVRS